MPTRLLTTNTATSTLVTALLAATVLGCGTDDAGRSGDDPATAEADVSPSAGPRPVPPNDDQLVPVIRQWAKGDDTGDGDLACTALTEERAEEERQEAQQDGDQFETCEEMYADDPPYYPKGELLEYQVEQRDPTVALVRVVFEGGGSGGSVYMFGLVPADGAWLIGDREELTD